MEAGQTIAGKYRLNRLLGTGGMASVWSATNIFTEREFAMKFMLPQVARTPEAARRFLLEAKVSARINHPNIIEVIDVGQAEDGSLFLVMELLTGSSLDVAVRRQEPPMLVHEFMLFMRDVAEALAAAHRSGVIHRDLKPTNIFLHIDRDGRMVPKILDFGVSKILEEENNTALTVVGTVLGSPLYMSPEQAMGAEGIDGRTDVFAFGAILFEALSGHRAYDAANFNALIVAIATSQPRQIDDVAPDLPEPLRALIRDCLVTDKTRRLESFDRIVARLDAMMPGLDNLEIHLPPPHRGEHASQPDREPIKALPVVRRSDRPPPPASVSLPPPARQISSAALASPSMNTSVRGWLQGAEQLVGLPPRTLAITAGGALVVVAVVVGVAAGLGRGSGAPPEASDRSVVSATSGGAVAPKIAAATWASTPGPSDVPVISVDSLPVATRGSPPAATAGKTGRLTVVSSPGSCSVYVDGVAHGVTPLTGFEVAGGVHRVDCTPPGGKPKSANVAVTDGAATHYKFALGE